MDNIFDPSHRKWISSLVHLGNCMEEMKRLVQLQAHELLVIDPVPKFTQTGESGDPLKRLMGRKPELENHQQNDKDGVDDVEAKADRLVEENTKKSEHKWTTSDAACEAAVNFVGGEQFFLFGKKKKEKEGKKGRGRKRRDEEERDEDEDSVDSDEEDDDEEDVEEVDLDDTQQGKQMDTRMYERFNYAGTDGGKSDEMDIDKVLRNMLTVERAEEKEYEHLVSDILDVSDAEEEYEDDDFELDATEGPASFAHKLDDMQAFIDSDSDNSDREDEQQVVNSSDEEEELNKEKEKEKEDAQKQKSVMEKERLPDGTINDGEMPCSSKSVPMNTDKSPAKQFQNIASAMFSGEKGKTRKSVTFNEDTLQAKDKNQPTPEPTPRPSKPSLGPSTESPTDPKRSKTSQDKDAGTQEQAQTEPGQPKDPITDFKRFTTWVFNQNVKRDQEMRQVTRPQFMKKFNWKEEAVNFHQSLTSSELAAVAGEVFQDVPVMQSSSMPVLAPPTSRAARTSLQSLAVFITHGEDPSIFPWKSINVQQQMNDDFVNHEFLKRMEQQKRDLVNPAMRNELVNKEDDFLLQVLIYQSTDPDEVLPDEVRLYLEPKLAYEVNLLGSQTVKDLMMSFHCENDYVCLNDTPHPDQFKPNHAKYAKDEFPEAMILINDTVYTNPNSTVDYVGIINAWAARPPAKKIGPFKRGDWNTKLRELHLRFGFPYVFIHLGGCEHIYVFTKSRLLHVEDDHLLKSYPKIVGMTRFKNVYCRVDNEYLARWAVLDYKEFPENPMLLCTECVLMYCYDQHKKKRGDFRLYPFTQMANIL